MEQNNLGGVADEANTNTTQASVSESLTDEQTNANLESEESSEESEQDAESLDLEESYEELLEKLKNDGVSLNKIKRFQKLNERARLATEYEKKLKAFEGSENTKTESKEEVKEQSQNKIASEVLDKSLDEFIESMDLPEFQEYEFDEEGKPIKGGYKTYKEMFKDFRKAMLSTLMNVSEFNRAKQERENAEITKYYNELDTDIKEVFTDDEGILDEETHKSFMDDLKKHHETLSAEDKQKPYVRKYLAKWLKTRSQTSTKPAPKKAEDEVEIAGRTGSRAKNNDEYIPGQSNPFRSI